MKRGVRGRDAKSNPTAWLGHDWRMDGDLFLTGLSTASESVGYFVNSGFCAGWWTLQPKPTLGWLTISTPVFLVPFAGSKSVEGFDRLPYTVLDRTSQALQ